MKPASKVAFFSSYIQLPGADMGFDRGLDFYQSGILPGGCDGAGGESKGRGYNEGPRIYSSSGGK